MLGMSRVPTGAIFDENIGRTRMRGSKSSHAPSKGLGGAPSKGLKKGKGKGLTARRALGDITNKANNNQSGELGGKGNQKAQRRDPSDPIKPQKKPKLREVVVAARPLAELVQVEAVEDVEYAVLGNPDPEANFDTGLDAVVISKALAPTSRWSCARNEKLAVEDFDFDAIDAGKGDALTFATDAHFDEFDLGLLDEDPNDFDDDF